MNEIICPKCGRANLAEADVCESCLTPLPKDSAGETPNWLQKIRDKSQNEKSKNPPLGEYGDAEERTFGEDVTPGEIPDWLKELQKLEPPKPKEPPEQTSDWMSRLHNVLPESDRQTLQSTTFYSQDELLAMAAAARKLEPADIEPPEKATTRPLDEPPESDSEDLTDGQSMRQEAPENLIRPFHEPDIFHPEDGVSGIPPVIQDEPPAAPDEEAPTFVMDAPEANPLQPQPESEIQPPIEVPNPQKKLKSDGVERSTQEPELFMPAEMEETESRLFDSLPGISEPTEVVENEPGKPEQLIPESILQPQYSHPVEYSGRLELSDSQKASINILKNMLVGEIQPHTPPPSGRMSGRAFRLITGILLILVMCIPLVTGLTITGQQALFSPGVVAMRTTITGLPESGSFLIITDFEPAFSSELKAASTGVIDSLMMKKMNFSILSTIPTGPALAHDLISSVRSGPMAYQPEKIAYLGYLPGGTTGLQDFIRGPRQAMPMMENSRYAWTFPAAQAITSIQDYTGILVITENTEIGRAWIEQLHGVIPNTPLLMVVSAQSAPLMRPYLDSDQLSGLIGGRIEGAMYDRIMEFPPRATAVTAAYQAGMLLAAGLMLLGGLYGLLRSPFSRRSNSSSEDWHVG